MRLSLKQRLFALIAVALAPALAILAYNEVDLRRSREAEVHALALRYGQLAASEMRQIFEGLRNLLISIAEAPAVQGDDSDACGRYLSDVVKRVPSVVAIFAADRQGIVRCTSIAEGPGTSIADRGYFTELQASDSFVVGPYTIDRISRQEILPLAMPVHDQSGALAGAVVAGLNLAWLHEGLIERGVNAGDALTIADRDGVIIFRDPMPERFVGTQIPDDYMHLIQATSPGTEEVVSQDGARRVIGYVPPSETGGVYVSASVSVDKAFAPVERATRWGIAAIVVATAIAVALAYLVGHRFIQSQVQQILSTISAWRSGRDDARTGMHPDRGELEAVGAAFDSLADELAARQAAQRKAEAQRDLLMRELTHRIKNTLATVQAIAGLTFRKGGVPPGVKKDFDARLAALGRAHDVLSAKSWHSASLVELLQQCTHAYQSGERQHFVLNGPDLLIKAQAVLALSMAFNELCTNAAKYGALSAAGGSVAVSWTLSPTGDDARFTLTWVERGGPPARPPTEEGFGSFLIKRLVAGDLGGNVELVFEASGLTCTIEAPASAMTEGTVVQPLRQSA